jgi:hypothetical protein
VTSLQTKRFSQQPQTAGNGDITDATPKVWNTIEKALIHHGVITVCFRHQRSHRPRTQTGIDSRPGHAFWSVHRNTGENTKALLRDWRQTILHDVIHC